MTEDAAITHAARRLTKARVLAGRDPASAYLQRELEKAEAKFVAAKSRTRPAHLKGERL